MHATRIDKYKYKLMVKIKKYIINNNILLTNEILEVFINNFWNDIFTPIIKPSTSEKHLMLMCKVEFTEKSLGYRTLGHLRKVNYNDKELFISYLSERIGHFTDAYTSHPIRKIIFSYIINKGPVLDNERALLQDTSDKILTTHRFNNMNLPISMNPEDYGNIESDSYVQVKGENYHRFIVSNGSKIFRIDRTYNNTINKVSILGSINLSWIDTLIKDESNCFMREINKSTIYFMDGEIILRKQMLPAKPFTRLVKETKLVNDFYTLDIETIKDNGKIIPYLICAYNGENYITSYGKNQKDLFTSFINQLLSNIKPGITYIYAHNLSGFDGIFLLKQLLDFGQIEPLLFNGKLISIKVKIKGDKKSETKILVFKDSYLLLPLSLRKLCNTFKLDVPKGYFPFLLTNIFYTGVLPHFKNWTGISLDVFESIVSEYKGKMWSFQQEAIKYCKLDCKTLHEILVKFNELIYNEFQININKPLTLPSLAMRIYKTHYMPKDTIYQLLGRPEWNIRESYTGGAVDVFIPHNRITSFIEKVNAFFIKLYYYDVNSLYPFVMATKNMPTGKPVAFEGDIRQIDPNAFGFFYCKIKSPDYLQHPILQRRIKTSEGLRTIAGLGSWDGWIYSDEMDNAVNYGYTFEIIKGYQFNKGNIFKEYILKMYDLRQHYAKTDAMNLIAKLLMNSLYGKFGMKLTSTELAIYDISTDIGKDSLKDHIEFFKESIQDFIKIDNYLLTIRNTMLSIKYNEKEDMYHGQDINIAIASAITAGSRIHMSQFKNNPLYTLYYSDTDSFVIDKALPIEMVGNKLGQVKLEHIIDKAVFLAPKVYGFVNLDGHEIIKVKGLTEKATSEINFNGLSELLIKDSSREFTQEKWYKKVIEGEITVADIVYTLKTTSNKRSPVYLNYNGIKVYNNTKPYNYDEIVNK